MTAGVNRQIVLAARPQGMVKASDFRLETSPVPEPGAGEALVRNLYMSVDPYMRGRMNDRKSYSPPFQIGRPLDGRAIGHKFGRHERRHPVAPHEVTHQGAGADARQLQAICCLAHWILRGCEPA